MDQVEGNSFLASEISDYQASPLISASPYTTEDENGSQILKKVDPLPLTPSILPDPIVKSDEKDGKGCEMIPEDEKVDDFELVQILVDRPMVRYIHNMQKSVFNQEMAEDLLKFKVETELPEQQTEPHVQSEVSSFKTEIEMCGSPKGPAKSEEIVNGASVSTNLPSDESSKQGNLSEEASEEDHLQESDDTSQTFSEIGIHKKRQVRKDKVIHLSAETPQENPTEQLTAPNQINEEAIEPETKSKTQSGYKFCYDPLLRYSFDFGAAIMSEPLCEQIYDFTLEYQNQASVIAKKFPFVAQEIRWLNAMPPAFLSPLSRAESLLRNGFSGLFHVFANIKKVFNINVEIFPLLKLQHIRKGSMKQFIDGWDRKYVEIKEKINGRKVVVERRRVEEKQFGVILIIVLTIAQEILQIQRKSKEALDSSKLFMGFLKKVEGNLKGTNLAFLLTLDCREHAYGFIQENLPTVINKMRALLNVGEIQSREEELQCDALTEIIQVIKGTQSLESFSQMMVAMKNPKSFK